MSDLDQFERKTFMEDAIDLGAARQLVGVHLVSGALDAFFKVNTKLLHHPESSSAQETMDIIYFLDNKLVLAVTFNKLTAVRLWSCEWDRSSGRKFLYSSTSFSSDRS